MVIKSDRVIWRSRDSSVFIATGYELDGLCLIPGKARFFSLYSTPSRPALGSSLLSTGYRATFPVVQVAPPSSAEIGNDGATPLLPNISSWHSA
jgi:hypothetical protein